MERLRVRSFAVGAFLIIAGVALQAAPKAKLFAKDEKFMEKAAPLAVGSYRFEPGPDNANQSYKVDDRTYSELKPFGVVGRIYSNGTRAFDVMLISGNDKQSFHDNRVCFQSQGYTIDSQTTEEVKTSRGVIPVTMLTLSHREIGKTLAAMFYKGPHNEWFPLPQPLTIAMLKEQLKMGTDLNSTFYRVIPRNPNTTQEELKAFIVEYVAAAEKSSNGFF